MASLFASSWQLTFLARSKALHFRKNLPRWSSSLTRARPSRCVAIARNARSRPRPFITPVPTLPSPSRIARPTTFTCRSATAAHKELFTNASGYSGAAQVNMIVGIHKDFTPPEIKLRVTCEMCSEACYVRPSRTAPHPGLASVISFTFFISL